MTNAERIREHFSHASLTDPAVAALVEEAARICDRLDHIDDIITGKSEWIELMHFRVRNGDLQEVHVSLDGVLSEARQQANTLKAVLTQLGVGKAELSPSEKASDPIDDLAKRRAARGAGPAAHPRRSTGNR